MVTHLFIVYASTDGWTHEVLFHTLYTPLYCEWHPSERSNLPHLAACVALKRNVPASAFVLLMHDM